MNLPFEASIIIQKDSFNWDANCLIDNNDGNHGSTKFHQYWPIYLYPS